VASSIVDAAVSKFFSGHVFDSHDSDCGWGDMRNGLHRGHGAQPQDEQLDVVGELAEAASARLAGMPMTLDKQGRM
jgi:hypothetical protein